MIFTFPEITKYKDWQARYRKHIRCMVWWEELRKPKPQAYRWYFNMAAPDATLFYPWFKDKTEWRKRSNTPKRCHYAMFGGDCAVQVPILELPNQAFILLDGAHRVRDLQPRLIVGDVITLKKEDQYCAIADTLGDWIYE